MRSFQQQATDRRPGASVLRITLMGSLLAVCILSTAGSGAVADGASLVGYGNSGQHAQPASGAASSAPDAVGGRVASSFSIAGSVAGLFPGQTLSPGHGRQTRRES